MCCEFWNGWFDHWYEKHHVREGDDTAKTFDEMLSCGGSVNFYMFHGGTNFGCKGIEVIPQRRHFFQLDLAIGCAGKVFHIQRRQRAEVFLYYSLHDRAHIFLDGKLAAVWERCKPGDKKELTVELKAKDPKRT